MKEREREREWPKLTGNLLTNCFIGKKRLNCHVHTDIIGSMLCACVYSHYWENFMRESMPICLVRRCLWTDKTDPTSVGLALSQFTNFILPSLSLISSFVLSYRSLSLSLSVSLSHPLIECLFSTLTNIVFFTFSEKMRPLVDNEVEKQFVYTFCWIWSPEMDFR